MDGRMTTTTLEALKVLLRILRSVLRTGFAFSSFFHQPSGSPRGLCGELSSGSRSQIGKALAYRWIKVTRMRNGRCIFAGNAIFSTGVPGLPCRTKKTGETESGQIQGTENHFAAQCPIPQRTWVPVCLCLMT